MFESLSHFEFIFVHGMRVYLLGATWGLIVKMALYGTDHLAQVTPCFHCWHLLSQDHETLPPFIMGYYTPPAFSGLRDHPTMRHL